MPALRTVFRKFGPKLSHTNVIYEEFWDFGLVMATDGQRIQAQGPKSGVLV
jgi:hypothetical protein